jgi:3-vinyl bacteriochlorophyllide hydratase
VVLHFGHQSGQEHGPRTRSGHAGVAQPRRPATARVPLYTPEQRRRRDESVWTLVQGVLAPVQFLVFLVSLGLVLRWIWTGEGYGAATISILLKTAILYAIMITGAIWEKVVFGKYLFADAFFWEDVVSMLVMGLQTLYVVSLVFGLWDPLTQVLIAVAAYGVYVVNAAQFVWKLRLARLDAAATRSDTGSETGSNTGSDAGLTPVIQGARP